MECQRQLAAVMADEAPFNLFRPSKRRTTPAYPVQRKDLERALQARQMFLHYQPKVELIQERVVGVEALLRWQHPEWGRISPSVFIPLAEQCGLIQPLGRWVLREACEQVRRWRDLGLGCIPVAVNLSAQQLRDATLVEYIQGCLGDFDLDPALLELEITESQVIDNPEQALAILAHLKQLGVTLTLDDFGTGQANLSYLSRLPLDKLKVDRSFIQRLGQQSKDATLVASIIDIGHRLNCRVVAEGVESAEQLAFVRRHLADEAQGYYFSEPLKADALAHYLGHRQPLHIPAREAPRAPRSVLIVDEEKHILSSMKRLLRQEDYQVLTASSAREALALLARGSIQVVLCDQRMQDADGVALLEQVRNDYPRTARMLMSANPCWETVLGAINRAQVFRLLPKPWEEVCLRESIQSAFKHAALARVPSRPCGCAGV